jgi:hypothetical protein
MRLPHLAVILGGGLLFSLPGSAQQAGEPAKAPTTCTEAYNYMIHYCDLTNGSQWCKPRQAAFRAKCMETGSYVTAHRTSPWWDGLKKQ